MYTFFKAQNKLTILIFLHVDTWLEGYKNYHQNVFSNVTLHHSDPRHNHCSDCEENTHPDKTFRDVTKRTANKHGGRS